MLVTRRLSGSVVDPLGMGRSLAHRPGLAVLASGDVASPHGRYSYVACDPEGEVRSFDPFEGAVASARPTDPFAFAPRFVGIVPYEARRHRLERTGWAPPESRTPPLTTEIRWARYPAVIAIDHHRAEAFVVGESEGAVRDLERRAEARGREADFELTVDDPEPPEAHVARVARAIELIRAGDLYQVNLARRLVLRLCGHGGGAPDPAAAFACFVRMAAAAPSAFGAFVAAPGGGSVLSTSPELALDASPSEDGRAFSALVTEPIKGTRPRGGDAEADAALARELDLDEKERAELSMIIDVERNDLARVSARGSVEVAGAPHVVTHRTVHHRVATVRGRARPDVSRTEVLEAMIPSGSVTGAPKVRAMEVIASLEPARRGLYTGALGYAGWDGSMRLSMAIRTAVFGPEGVGEYGVGGGIVVDSDPGRELEETRWKSLQLQKLVRGGRP